MRGGELDRRVTLLYATTEPNGLGEEVETWRTLATVWASYSPTSDGERVRAAEVAAVIEARFRIRWSRSLTALTPKNRLRFEGREFNIIGVKEIGRREGLEISAAARAE
ncbi:phage head closure protein [Phenylobacterium sp.]|uniref:phage head closure protein n=1 Tax=Phenylobacterium sp. TaxID=1871053 RepID=UPI0039557ADE